MMRRSADEWRGQMMKQRGDDLNVPDIPMRAEGDTPKWSEVERAEFACEDPMSENNSHCST